jgi:hypothetical protein
MIEETTIRRYGVDDGSVADSPDLRLCDDCAVGFGVDLRAGWSGEYAGMPMYWINDYDLKHDDPKQCESCGVWNDEGFDEDEDF